jgi:Sortase domain
MIRRRIATGLLASGVALGITGVGGSGAGAVGVPAAPVPPPARALARVAVAEPARLRIPLLGVDAAIVPVTVGSAGELRVPDDPQVLGWWRAGGAPGVPGAAGVLDGHVDSAADGPGALFRAAALRPGDAVTVESASGSSHAFVVRSVRRYAKATLPTEVFRAGPDPQLVLITCGGHFDHSTGQYEDNVVVVASAQS